MLQIEDSTMSQEEQNNSAEFLIDAYHKQKQGDEGGDVEEWKVTTTVRLPVYLMAPNQNVR